MFPEVEFVALNVVTLPFKSIPVAAVAVSVSTLTNCPAPVVIEVPDVSVTLPVVVKLFAPITIGPPVTKAKFFEDCVSASVPPIVIPAVCEA